MIKDLLMSSNYWVLNKSIVKEFGIETAFVLSNLAEAENILSDEEGWFYQTAETIEALTGLSNHKQTISIKQLIDCKAIEQKNKGIPMKRYFKINYEIIEKLVFKNFENYSLKNCKTSIQKISNNKESNDKELTNKKNKDIYVDKPQTHKFIIPTIEEVETYCKERNNNVDAEKFIDFYTAKGWMVGKNKMKDWKAAIRTWEGNNGGNRRDNSKDADKPKYDFSRFGG